MRLVLLIAVAILRPADALRIDNTRLSSSTPQRAIIALCATPSEENADGEVPTNETLPPTP